MPTSPPLTQRWQQGVHPVQAPPPPFPRERLAGLRWDDLALFLHVAETHSLRAAALRAHISVNTVRKRITRIEDQLRDCLLERSPRGVTLTPAGQQLREVGTSMRGAAVADGIDSSAYLRRPDELRIGTSEGLGSGWLTPRLLQLHKRFPDLTMSMLCSNDLELDRSQDLDIGIVWQRPRNPDLIAARLATLHFMPFASVDYVNRYGAPDSAENLLHHRFIEQAAPGVKSSLLDQLVGSDRPPGFLPIRTNSSLAIFWAVANGAGIAYMPTYATTLVPRLVPIDLPFRVKFDIFYYYHPEGRASPVVMAGIDWLKSCFDPQAHPWFRSEFIHPSQFVARAEGNVVPLFQTLV
jgi:DNA-binding transcriptional LysR family regulator